MEQPKICAVYLQKICDETGVSNRIHWDDLALEHLLPTNHNRREPTEKRLARAEAKTDYTTNPGNSTYLGTVVLMNGQESDEYEDEDNDDDEGTGRRTNDELQRHHCNVRFVLVPRPQGLLQCPPVTDPSHRTLGPLPIHMLLPI